MYLMMLEDLLTPQLADLPRKVIVGNVQEHGAPGEVQVPVPVHADEEYNYNSAHVTG